MLIIFGGLPGVGKTTVARALADALGACYLRIDTIEQALRTSGELPGGVTAAGYITAYAVALDNLRLGRVVIADSVNPIEITRQAWRGVAGEAGVQALEVEITCSDPTEHRRRVETRLSDIPGLVQPDWAKVQARDYEDWGDRPLRFDTAAARPEEIVADLLVHPLLRQRP
ncbi:AAA family ATPase [Lacibacterium aquatile]|uniref:AAA family ATPase n=1 Tax=Lacibacterium aquatile TaxID=1168082 RepID=A0ABW5DRS3_9PROT